MLKQIACGAYEFSGLALLILAFVGWWIITP